jgi:Fic family protein
MKLTERQLEIFWIIFKTQPINIGSILTLLNEKVSIPTLNRELTTLKGNELIHSQGVGPSTKYNVILKGLITANVSVDQYYETELDARSIFEKFNFNLFKELSSLNIFSEDEIQHLDNLTDKYHHNIKGISKVLFQKEFERLTIELSWKSAQIEGNTYDLLDTEQLLKYNILSKKNSKEEAIVLLNHKIAIDFSNTHAKEFKKLSTRNITELHTLLTSNMGIAKNMRKRVVRITGTKYTPPENQFLIEEYLQNAVELINKKKNIYEKALLAILLISYIQPFEDGNKRTARITANALLIGHKYCPLSYRSVVSTDYKKAILLFYEINNLSAFKKLFIEQYEFAVNTYF